MMLPTFEAFRAHAEAEAGRECCGLILRLPCGSEAYRRCGNASEEPEEHFQLREEDWIEAERTGEVLAVCHSHQGAAMPGPADLEACAEHGLPWHILGSDALQRIDPEPVPLLERPFVYGWSDCYSLVRDWFWATRAVRLPDFPREEKFWETGHSPYVEQFAACGFREVSDLMPGDALLMAIGESPIPNHAAVYLGEGRILHHLFDQLSRQETYSGRWQSRTTHRLRLA